MYRAPLFLDCCALITKAVNDLSDDFGFKIDDYNQGYQFDTLPIVVEPGELQPGDIIFYEGLHVNEQKRT